MAMLIEFEGRRPQVHESAFLAPTAVLIGDVVIGREASVWFGVVLRADLSAIRIGAYTNIQDNTVIHSDTEDGTVLGELVTVGHGAVLHDTTIGDRCMVGMKATLLHGSKIGAGSLIAAGSVVREGFEVPPGSIAAGIPAKVLKPLEGNAAAWLDRASEGYLELSKRYRSGARTIGEAT